ncbi:hypothetical protein ACFLQ8_03170 [Candidatus Auribacterota bacterium]
MKAQQVNKILKTDKLRGGNEVPLEKRDNKRGDNRKRSKNQKAREIRQDKKITGNGFLK